LRTLSFSVIAVILAACGAGSSPTASSRTPNPSSASPSPSASLCSGKKVAISLPCPINEFSAVDLTKQGKTVHTTFTLGDGSFDPTFVKITPGAKVTLTLDASGTVSHNFTIDAIGFKEDVTGFSKKTVAFTLPATGPVRFYCSIHIRFGMQGAFYFS
jgi:plastocyanin